MTNAQNTSRAMIGDIPVFCAYDEILPIAKALPNPQNPNRHPDKQINLLAEIIKQQGWRAPITISNRSGYIVRGHGRLMAARLLGAEFVPVDFQNYESDAAEKADMIADNRIAEFSELDEDVLAELLADINDSDLDIELAGIELEELDQFLEIATSNENEFLDTSVYTSDAQPQKITYDPPSNDEPAPAFTPPDYEDDSFAEDIQRKQGQTGEIDINDYAEDKYHYECPKCKFKW